MLGLNSISHPYSKNMLMTCMPIYVGCEKNGTSPINLGNMIHQFLTKLIGLKPLITPKDSVYKVV